MRESRNHAGKPRTAPRRLWPFESAHEYAEPSTGHVEPRKSGYLQSCVIASTTGAIYQTETEMLDKGMIRDERGRWKSTAETYAGPARNTDG